MKYLLGVLVIAAAGYLFYSRQKPVQPSDPVAVAVPVAPAPIGVPKPEAPPAAVPPASAPAPTPIARRLAQEGTYYVMQRISVPTDDGIVGIATGTKVTAVNAGLPFRVTDGKTQFGVAPGQVTNDLDVAARKEAAMQKTLADVRAAYYSNGRTTFNGKHPGLMELRTHESDLERVTAERAGIENQIAEVQK